MQARQERILARIAALQEQIQKPPFIQANDALVSIRHGLTKIRSNLNASFLRINQENKSLFQKEKELDAFTFLLAYFARENTRFNSAESEESPGDKLYFKLLTLLRTEFESTIDQETQKADLHRKLLDFGCYIQKTKGEELLASQDTIMIYTSREEFKSCDQYTLYKITQEEKLRLAYRWYSSNMKPLQEKYLRESNQCDMGFFLNTPFAFFMTGGVILMKEDWGFVAASWRRGEYKKMLQDGGIAFLKFLGYLIVSAIPLLNALTNYLIFKPRKDAAERDLKAFNGGETSNRITWFLTTEDSYELHKKHRKAFKAEIVQMPKLSNNKNENKTENKVENKSEPRVKPRAERDNPEERMSKPRKFVDTLDEAEENTYTEIPKGKGRRVYLTHEQWRRLKLYEEIHQTQTEDAFYAKWGRFSRPQTSERNTLFKKIEASKQKRDDETLSDSVLLLHEKQATHSRA